MIELAGPFHQPSHRAISGTAASPTVSAAVRSVWPPPSSAVFLSSFFYSKRCDRAGTGRRGRPAPPAAKGCRGGVAAPSAFSERRETDDRVDARMDRRWNRARCLGFGEIGGLYVRGVIVK